MNSKQLLKIGVLVVAMLMFFVGTSLATTYYVNVQTGLDTKDGLTPGNAKHSITNAIAAAAPGDVISIDWANGNPYLENVTVNKVLTFVRTDATSNSASVTSWTVFIDATVAAGNTCTFTGAFTFESGLTIIDGSIVGGTNLTVKTQLTRYGVAGTHSTTVSGQLNFSGDVDVTYITDGNAMTTGLDLPVDGNTNMNNWDITGSGIVTFDANRTMKGILNVASGGGLALATHTLTINGANAHLIGANVLNGTVNFVMDGATSVNNNARILPVITASGSGTLTLNGSTLGLGSITVAGSVNVDVLNFGGSGSNYLGAVTNNGSGDITLTLAQWITSLANNSSGKILVNGASTVTVSGGVSNSGTGLIQVLNNSNVGAVSNSNSGYINFIGNLTATGLSQTGVGFLQLQGSIVTINGNVSQNIASLPLTDATVGIGDWRGVIRFTSAVTINGSVTNTVVFTGTAGNSTNWTNAGEIRFFAPTDPITITGSVTVNASNSYTWGGTTAATVNNCGDVVLATTGGTVIIDGGINNTSNWVNVTSIASSWCGIFDMSARTWGYLGTSGRRIGAISNTSTTTGDLINGNILLGGTTCPTYYGVSVSSSGGHGGQILFGNYSINISGNVTNSRTVAADHIQFGSTPTAGLLVTISGSLQNINASPCLSTTTFPGFEGNGSENFVIGNLNCQGGQILVGGSCTGIGQFQIGTINAITGGVVTLGNYSGPARMNVVVSGNTNFIGGTFNMGTTFGADGRILELDGYTHTFSSATGSTNFMNDANCQMLVKRVITFVAPQTLTGNLTETVWPGTLYIDNITGIPGVDAVVFNGGNFRILKDVTFNTGQVHLDNMHIFIGGQAPGPTGSGSFINNPGYVTTGDGFVTINGNNSPLQIVSGAGQFGNFEADAVGPVRMLAGVGPFTGIFGLTKGTVGDGGGSAANIIFNHAAPNYPTIRRNAGVFDAAPNFAASSMVNVYYIGIDKGTSWELPTATDKLWDLTAATTNGNVAGQGTVDVTVSTTVNGKLIVFPNQCLDLINGTGTVTLTMLGDSIILGAGGDLSNRVGTSALILARPTGTEIKGAGAMPDIQVAVGSWGNMIDGSVGLATNLLGANGVRGGGDDVVPGTAGTITFLAGATPSQLKVKFAQSPASGAHFGISATTNDAVIFNGPTSKGRFDLCADMICLGNLVINSGGTFNDSSFVARFEGWHEAIHAGSNIIGAGSLMFVKDVESVHNIDVFDGKPTINTNVIFATYPGLTNTSWTITSSASPAADTLVIAGQLRLDSLAAVTMGTNHVLEVTGNYVRNAPGTSWGTTGTLHLNPSSPPLAFEGHTTIPNLWISGNVNFTGDAIVVTGAFIHDGGLLDYTGHDFTINGTYTHSHGASYTCGAADWFIFAGTAFNQGQTDLTIKNLSFEGSGATSINDTGMVNIPHWFRLNRGNDTNIDITGPTPTTQQPKLAIAHGDSVFFIRGTMNAVPVYAPGSIYLITQCTANRTIDANLWPATPTNLVIDLVLQNGGSTIQSILPGSRTVNVVLNLQVGILTVGNNILTIPDSATIRRRETGSVTVGGSGSIALGMTNVVYEPTAASAGGDITTGPELANAVNNLTITRVGTPANALVTLGHDLVINGTLAIRNNFSMGTRNITINGHLIVSNEVTVPVITFNGTLTFGGALPNQTVQLLGTLNPKYLTLNKTVQGFVNVSGGDLNVDSVLTFINGVIKISSPNAVVLHQTNTRQGFNHTGVVYGVNLSHVWGKIKQAILVGQGQVGTNGRYEYPVGGQLRYRPMAITFTPNYPVISPTNIEVKSVDSLPLGTKDLPLNGGYGVSIRNYPAYYWLVSSTPGSFTQTQAFDVELQGMDLVYPDIKKDDLRIIRRYDGNVQDHGWVMQGDSSTYTDNWVDHPDPINYPTDSIAVVRSSSTYGGIVTGGERFTIGIPARNPEFLTVLANTSIAQTDSVSFTYTAKSNNIDGTISSYQLVSPPAGATINSTTGVMKYKPGYATVPGIYDITVKVFDGTLWAQTTAQVTVTKSNRPPEFTSVLAVDTVKERSPLSFTYVATDADEDALTYTLADTTFGAHLTTGGVLTWTPTFAQAGHSFIFAVTVQDVDAATAVTTHTVFVKHSRAKGDVNGINGISTSDATFILQYIVGIAPGTTVLADPAALWAADVTGDGTVSALDAAYILQYLAHRRTLPTTPNVLSKPVVASGTLSWGNLVSGEAGAMTLPLKVKDASNIYSVQIKANIGLLKVEDLKANLPGDWMISYRAADGKLLVAAAGVTPISDGDIATICFKVEKDQKPEKVEADVLMNESTSQTLTAEVAALPTQFALENNYPNPFNPTTTIKYQLPADVRVNVTIYNIQGQVVRTLVSEDQKAGYYTIQWDGRSEAGTSVATGIYIYRINAGSFVTAKKMVMMK